MRDLPSDKLNVVTDDFRTIEVLSGAICGAVACCDQIPPAVADQIGEDASIIAFHIGRAISVLDEHYPGLRELITLADKRTEERTAEIIAQQGANQPRH